CLVSLPSTCSLYRFMFFFSCSVNHLDLHSFPTRRSSDLGSGNCWFRCSHRSGSLSDAAAGDGALTRGCRNGGHLLRGGDNWAKLDRKSTRLNSSHGSISYAVFCLKKKKIKIIYINTQKKQ